jgi:hypothetical protein
MATVVPVVASTRVSEKTRRLGDIPFGASALRNPHDVGLETRRRRLPKQLLMDFGGPPKTGPSSG